MKSMRLVFFIVLVFFANASLAAAPCASKEEKAKERCIKQSTRDDNYDYLIIASRTRDGEVPQCGYIVYRSQEFARCGFREASCFSPPSDIVPLATIIPRWETAQNRANYCEFELDDSCSLGGCRVNVFVVVRIRDEASATAMGPQITDWEEPSIGSLLNVAPEQQ
ncbi:MAG: hypothetical protein ACREYF_19850 [Gammaproteobacteria bacterium]